MSFNAKPKADLLVDLLVFNNLTTFSAGTVWTVNDTPINTSAVIDSNGYIQLHNNSSWRLEANVLARFNSYTADYYFKVQFYDGANYIGQYGRPSKLSNTEQTKGSCSVLLPASTISTSITIYPKVESMLGTPNYDGTYAPLPSIRIYEIKH